MGEVSPEVIERVARAIYEAVPIAKPLEGQQWTWDFMVAEKWTMPDEYSRMSVAAIAALSPDNAGDEVTEKMIADAVRQIGRRLRVNDYHEEELIREGVRAGVAMRSARGEG